MYSHLYTKSKKRLQDAERQREIDRENRILRARMATIFRQNPHPRMSDMIEFSTGIRLTKAQTPRLDNFISMESKLAGAARFKPSLNIEMRRKRAEAINRDNKIIMKRIAEAPGAYDVAKWEDDRKRAVRMMRYMKFIPPTLPHTNPIIQTGKYAQTGAHGHHGDGGGEAAATAVSAEELAGGLDEDARGGAAAAAAAAAAAPPSGSASKGRNRAKPRRPGHRGRRLRGQSSSSTRYTQGGGDGGQDQGAWRQDRVGNGHTNGGAGPALMPRLSGASAAAAGARAEAVGGAPAPQAPMSARGPRTQPVSGGRRAGGSAGGGVDAAGARQYTPRDGRLQTAPRSEAVSGTAAAAPGERTIVHAATRPVAPALRDGAAGGRAGRHGHGGGTRPGGAGRKLMESAYGADAGHGVSVKSDRGVAADPAPTAAWAPRTSPIKAAVGAGDGGSGSGGGAAAGAAASATPPRVNGGAPAAGSIARGSGVEQGTAPASVTSSEPRAGTVPGAGAGGGAATATTASAVGESGSRSRSRSGVAAAATASAAGPTASTAAQAAPAAVATPTQSAQAGGAAGAAGDASNSPDDSYDDDDFEADESGPGPAT